jgi:hypothetical protein
MRNASYPRVRRALPFGALLLGTLAVTLNLPVGATEEELAPPPTPPDEALAPPPGPPDEELAPSPEKKPSQPQEWSAWAGVREFRGVHTIVRTFDKDRDNGVRRETGHHVMEATLRFRLVRRENNNPFDRSFDPVDGQIIGRDEARSHAKDWAYDSTSSVTGIFSGAVKDVSFTYGLRGGQWLFSTGGFLVEPYVLTTALKTHALREGRWRDEADTQTRTTKTYAHAVMRGPLPAAKPTILVARQVIPYVNKETGVTEEIRSTLMLVPVCEDAEVEVEIEAVGRTGQTAYEQWIPAGTLTGAAGAHLQVTARAKGPNGRKPDFAVKEFVFRLNATSREPGVCLNFPLNATPKGGKRAAPDLKFAGAGGGNDAEFQEKRLPSTTDQDGLPSAQAVVECFDWGAWGDLTVTAMLDDGREVAGHLKGDQAAVLIPLPKRGAGSYIADAWKQQHRTTAGDDDDDEKDPPSKDGDGDGFTLYEEYRGFVEDGRHVEGDPARKDFFVLNLIGADARAGIALFETDSGLRVHSRLRPAEMSQQARLMNGNHAEAPHRVDQHGVWIKEFPSVQTLGVSGAATPLTKAGVAGRPGLTIGIGILARNDPDSDFNQPYNLPARDVFVAYDRAIAHELLHSVGVEHHGTGNYRCSFCFQFADDPDNPTHRVRFAAWAPESTVGYMLREKFGTLADAEKAGPTLTLKEEDTHRDYAEELAADMERARASYWARMNQEMRQYGQEFAAAHPGIGRTADYWTQRHLFDELRSLGVFEVNIGVKQGEDSGAEECLMRYYFSGAYPVGTSERDYILIPSGTNPVGMEICRSPKGTGVNATSHKPESRHGDAGVGDCQDQICPNDALPPRKAKS